MHTTKTDLNNYLQYDVLKYLDIFIIIIIFLLDFELFLLLFSIPVSVKL